MPMLQDATLKLTLNIIESAKQFMFCGLPFDSNHLFQKQELAYLITQIATDASKTPTIPLRTFLGKLAQTFGLGFEDYYRVIGTQLTDIHAFDRPHQSFRKTLDVTMDRLMPLRMPLTPIDIIIDLVINSAFYGPEVYNAYLHASILRCSSEMFNHNFRNHVNNNTMFNVNARNDTFDRELLNGYRLITGRQYPLRIEYWDAGSFRGSYPRIIPAQPTVSWSGGSSLLQRALPLDEVTETVLAERDSDLDIFNSPERMSVAANVVENSHPFMTAAIHADSAALLNGARKLTHTERQFNEYLGQFLVRKRRLVVE